MNHYPPHIQYLLATFEKEIANFGERKGVAKEVYEIFLTQQALIQALLEERYPAPKEEPQGYYNVHLIEEHFTSIIEWYDKNKREADYQDKTTIISLNGQLWMKRNNDNQITDWEAFCKTNSILRFDNE